MHPVSSLLDEPASLEAFLKQTLSPGLFFANRDHQLVFHPLKAETITWEIFRGQLLDTRHTREKQTFLSCHVRIKPARAGNEDPLLTIRISPSTLHPPPSTLHVTRWLHCHVWEAFDDHGVVASHEVERWIEELVGTVAVADFNDVASLMHELRLLAFHAFVGLSRLPLNSVEAPLPGFSLGVIGFFPTFEEADACVSNPLALLERQQGSVLEESKLVELYLRTASVAELPRGAEEFARQASERSQTDTVLAARLRRLFNETSLTPYTDFVAKSLTFARLLFEQGSLLLDAYAGFLLSLVRQTVYHLTAYDLITFHHQGANYPDALLLDALLREVLRLANAHPRLFLVGPGPDELDLEGWTTGEVQLSNRRTRRRRRALLLGWWMYRFLEGLLVPDEPTSPGENARMLPPPHRRVPEEQLQQRSRRTRRLFSAAPINWKSHQGVLDICLEELADPAMLLELGTALYLDRPFGSTKPPGALDLTPLLSYELFSRAVVRERLSRIAQVEPELRLNPVLTSALKLLEELEVSGIPVPRPAIAASTVRLQDCWRVADDFIVRRATPETIRQLLAYFNWEAYRLPLGNEKGLLNEWHEEGLLPVPVPATKPDEPTRFIFYDSKQNPWFECSVAAEEGFRRRGALELPVPGLKIMCEGVSTVIKSRGL